MHKMALQSVQINRRCSTQQSSSEAGGMSAAGGLVVTSDQHTDLSGHEGSCTPGFGGGFAAPYKELHFPLQFCK